MTDKPTRRTTSDTPLNGPDAPSEEKGYQAAGQLPPDEQSAVVDAQYVDGLGDLTETDIYEGELEAGVNDDSPDDVESLDMMTELELRDGETDDPMEAAEEGLTYVPPIDPPTVPGGDEGAEIASGFGVSALDEAYDRDHHDTFYTDDDEMSARVREALRADSSTTQYADRIAILTRGGVVTLRGEVDDMIDSDQLLAVAGYVEGVAEVLDELRLRGVA